MEWMGIFIFGQFFFCLRMEYFSIIGKKNFRTLCRYEKTNQTYWYMF